MDSKSNARALQFISQSQRENGGFYGYASSSCDNFLAKSTLPTTFFTSLILHSLQHVPGSTRIISKAAQYLIGNKSNYGSWNYWEACAKQRKTNPYPDDLDDTACALLALSSYDNKLVGGPELAELTKLLIATEVAPGGPYRTWLINSPDKKWNDVDIVVNANIGRLLAVHSVSLKGLEKFIGNALKNDALLSPYYVGRVPAVYFLAPWYKGKNAHLLKEIVQEELENKNHNALMLSMLISTSCALGCPINELSEHADRLIRLRQDDHWPAEALYIHSSNPTKTTYAGSAALTTVLALRALHDIKLISNTKPKSNIQKPIKSTARFLNKALKYSNQLAPSDLRTNYLTHLRATIKNDSSGQITNMAEITAQAYSTSLSQATKDHLNLGSLHGWIAYTIYDDFLDNEGQPKDLGVANFALRQTAQHFKQALPGNQVFHKLVDSTLNQVDQANAWETTHARATLQKNKVIFKHLPDYKDYSQLAERSWGHMLAAAGVILESPHITNTSRQLQYLQAFFHHYLIARQLNDDAHDWEQDLRNGQLSAVVTLLLKNYPVTGKVDLVNHIDSLRLFFWDHTLLDIGQLIKSHTSQARQALSSSAIKNPTNYLGWLSALDGAIDLALSKRKETKEFVATYSNPSSK